VSPDDQALELQTQISSIRLTAFSKQSMPDQSGIGVGERSPPYNSKRRHPALGHLSPTDFLTKPTAPALEHSRDLHTAAQHCKPTG
jgi:hypothetical protein